MQPGLSLLALLLLGDAPKLNAPSIAPTYEKVAPAVVGITCTLGRGLEYFGTGAIIDPKGLVITSVTVVPKDARSIRVYLRGGLVLKAKTALWNAEKELALLKIDPPKDPREFSYLRLGDSDAIQLGKPAITLGNAFHSIEADDQVALGEGVFSGAYTLHETLDQSKYEGRVIETTAHVNDGMDGGPLVDAQGDLVGILCLSYSRIRWLGTAVPINELKPLIAEVRGWLNDHQEDFPAYAGLEVEELGDTGIRVLRVFAQSPASAAGLAVGDRLVGAQGKSIDSVKALREILSGLKAEDTLRVDVDRGGKTVPIEIRLSRKNRRWI